MGQDYELICETIKTWCVELGNIVFDSSEITSSSRIISFSIPRRNKKNILEYLKIKFPEISESYINDIVEKYID